MIRIHYLQHDSFEDLSYIGDWAVAKGHSISCTRIDLNEMLPAIENFDWLIIMGGKMGVYERDKYPVIEQELQLIEDAISAKKTLLGICLGSQMIAAALGASVYPHRHAEIGFFPVTFHANAQKDPVFRHFGKECLVLHIHNDTFDLPEGAILMASSGATDHQAFRYGDSVFALQFHFEATAERTLTFIREAMTGLGKGKWIQATHESKELMKVCEANNFIFKAVLDAIEMNYFKLKTT
jgi:GMP synthase (glutamine-hydrolysing)